jgi:hypothetical protein
MDMYVRFHRKIDYIFSTERTTNDQVALPANAICC